MRASFFPVCLFALLAACSSDDDVAFKPPAPQSGDAGAGGTTSGGGATSAGGTTSGEAGNGNAGTSGEGAAAGSSQGGAGTEQGGGAGSEQSGGSGGGEGGAPGEPGGQGGGGASGGGGNDPGPGGAGGNDPGTAAVVCAYAAFAESTLAKIEEHIAAGLAEGYDVHALLGRPENNGGAALPNVAWLVSGGQFKGYGNMDPGKLASTVSSELAKGAAIHTLIARAHGSSVPTEVTWSQKGTSVRAHQRGNLGDLGDDLNDDADDGYGLIGLFAREGNNGNGTPNVVWLKNADEYFSRDDFDIKKLATQVTKDVKEGAQVVRFLARPHSSSVPTEVAWLEKAGTIEAFQSSSLTTQATTINTKLAAGYTVRALFSREENNPGGSLANVAWLVKGNTMKAIQDQSAPKLAQLVTAELAGGWALHTVLARPTGSPAPPEVVWMSKPCPP